MRIVIATLVALLAGSALDAAKADPYPWCAVYGGSDSGGTTNCYFLTLEQCRANVSGIGGFCSPNTFYDGRPVSTPGEAVRRRRAAAPR